MPSPLKTRLQDDIKEAMRAKDSARLGVLRMIAAAIKQREVDERIELDDEQIVSVLGKMVKQHQDSIEQYRKGGREDLVEKEVFELELIASYLPPALPEAELILLIDQAIAATSAQSVKDMGKVMAELKPKIQGRADMGVVSARIRARLGA
ncbi:MAG: GatB/YqeY domain-containing protein [Chromatiales bacterium]|nr:GatB/YqeY domain-containing protein [Chromatiales bacterium]